MLNKKPLIIRDTREKYQFWDFPEDNYFNGTVSRTIKYGDYTIDGFNNIFIDRKRSTGEIASNMLKESFWNLMENARQLKYRFLIMEFSYTDILNFPVNSHLPTMVTINGRLTKNIITKIQPEFLLESIARISTEFNINPIFADNRNNAEQIALFILKEIYKLENAV